MPDHRARRPAASPTVPLLVIAAVLPLVISVALMSTDSAMRTAKSLTARTLALQSTPAAPRQTMHQRHHTATGSSATGGHGARGTETMSPLVSARTTNVAQDATSGTRAPGLRSSMAMARTPRDPTCPIGASAGQAACGPVGPLAANGGPFLTDAAGRKVILHGVDAVYKHAPYELYVDPGKPWNFTAADARAIAGLGFDVVRLGILWKGIEPGTLGPNNPAICTPGTPGHAHQWNQAIADTYLARVRQTVDLLGRYGIFSLLDMHQDVYNEVFAGEGAPNWAVCTDGIPPTNTGTWEANYAEPAVAAAYNNFWTNDVVGNLQGNYDRAWHAVAKTFAGNADVVGYDLFNEPFATEALTVAGAAVFDAQLECFYTGRADPGRLWISPLPLVCPPDDPAHGAIPTIRAVDPTTPIFYEPDVTSDFGDMDWIGPMPYRHLVLNFHDYCLASDGSASFSSSSLCGDQERQTLAAQASARSTAADPENPGGPAWFMSEFGAEPAGTDLARMVALANENLVGWAYWQWEYYDDPTGGPSEGLASTDPASGAPILDTAKAAILSEPYAQAVAGTPTAMAFDPGTDIFTVTYEVDLKIHAPTVVFVPVAIHYPDGYCATASGATITSAAGARHLTVQAHHNTRTVTVSVTPGRCPSTR